MCNPYTFPNATTAIRAQRTTWVQCKDVPGVHHFVGNSHGVTVGADHNHPQLYSATDGAGTFNILAPTRVQAMIAYMRHLASAR